MKRSYKKWFVGLAVLVIAVGLLPAKGEAFDWSLKSRKMAAQKGEGLGSITDATTIVAPSVPAPDVFNGSLSVIDSSATPQGAMIEYDASSSAGASGVATLPTTYRFQTIKSWRLFEEINNDNIILEGSTSSGSMLLTIRLRHGRWAVNTFDIEFRISTAEGDDGTDFYAETRCKVRSVR